MILCSVCDFKVQYNRHQGFTSSYFDRPTCEFHHGVKVKVTEPTNSRQMFRMHSSPLIGAWFVLSAASSNLNAPRTFHSPPLPGTFHRSCQSDSGLVRVLWFGQIYNGKTSCSLLFRVISITLSCMLIQHNGISLLSQEVCSNRSNTVDKCN